jgi:hypothetical protein
MTGTGYPHLRYVDAVHATFVVAGQPPARVKATSTDGGELLARFEWPDVTIQWSHLDGWKHDAPHSGGALKLDWAASPAAVATCVALLLDGFDPLASEVRWAEAGEFDAALSGWEARA